MNYIAFLRAVNVGGRTVKMDRLRQLFERLGFTEVSTYIQSGNVFFESPEKDQHMLSQKIESALKTEFGFEVSTVVRSTSQVESALSGQPFKAISADENTRLCIVFVTQPLPDDCPIVSAKGDVELIGATDGEVFAVVHQQPGKAVSPAAFIEKTYPDIKATARFHHTMKKMMEKM